MRAPRLWSGALACALVACAAPAVSLELANGAFRVTGWNAPASPPAKGWSSLFAVYTGPADGPQLLGAYSVEGGALTFRPRFPFAPGVRYRAVFRSPDGVSVERIFEGPSKPTIPEARVEAVYPSAAVLPSNILRLYVYFSAPMSRGEAGAHLRILDDKKKPLEGVFLPGEELWDPTGRRLTMTFDPGRIKRGLTSNQKMGPPIAEGRLYNLVIDREWLDARGVAMKEGFRKTFRGGPANRVSPDPAKWRIAPPKAGTVDALSVEFGEPMNSALLQRMLSVQGPGGGIEGTVSTGPEERTWRFVPQSPWRAGDYRIVVDTNIEDLAGNHIGQAFDIDVFEHVTEHIATKTVSLTFRVR